jgi:hypothetical protein
MSTTSAIAHYQASIPATPSAPLPVSVRAYGKTDGDADQGVETGLGTSRGPTVNLNLSHAVQQALGHLHADAKIPVSDSTTPELPMTMQGFIQALIASLHQIGGLSPAGSASPAQSAGVQAVSAGGKYAPVATNDVQSLIRQTTTILSSNTALQQDFQSMLRAAGVDQSSTSLQHFLRSVSSQMKPSSVVDAIA